MFHFSESYKQIASLLLRQNRKTQAKLRNIKFHLVLFNAISNEITVYLTLEVIFN